MSGDLPLSTQALFLFFKGISLAYTTWLQLQDVFTLFLGLLIEAFPFIVLGVLVSTVVGIYLRDDWVERFVPKNRIASHTLLALVGALVPVCQCGNVPVAKRLITKGFSPSHAITFILAAPIVNPITFITTLAAFGVTPWVAGLRVGLGFAIALVVGLLWSYGKVSGVRPEIFEESAEVCNTHEHSHSTLERAVQIFKAEFVSVFSMLMVGALVAAIIQTLLPMSIIEPLGSHVFFSIIAMMVLSFVIALCSNVDAFFVLSYSATFTTGSLMAFMLFGPTINIKMVPMLRSVFTARALLLLATLVGVLTILIGLSINTFYATPL